MPSTPAGRLEIANIEVTAAPLPLRAEPGPRSVVPSKNSSAPVGAALPLTSVIVAVNVTAPPKVDGLSDEDTPVVVRASTFSVYTGLVLLGKFPVPVKTAVMDCGPAGRDDVGNVETALAPEPVRAEPFPKWTPLSKN